MIAPERNSSFTRTSSILLERTSSLRKMAPDLGAMRGFIQRNTGIGQPKKSTCLQDNTESNIFCSDMVGHDFVVSKFEQVSKSSEVVKLELEDLITGSCHHGLVPSLVEKLLVADDRDWEYIRFVDNIPVDYYEAWNLMKGKMMSDYETLLADLPTAQVVNVITWRATISIQEGTTVEELTKLFKNFKEDKVMIHLDISGDAFGVKGTAEDLASLIDWNQNGGQLTSKITVQLVCGWTLQSSSCKLLVNCCIHMLKRGDRETLPSRRVGSAPSLSDAIEATTTRVPRRSYSGRVRRNNSRVESRKLPLRSKSGRAGRLSEQMVSEDLSKFQRTRTAPIRSGSCGERSDALKRCASDLAQVRRPAPASALAAEDHGSNGTETQSVAQTRRRSSFMKTHALSKAHALALGSVGSDHGSVSTETEQNTTQRRRRSSMMKAHALALGSAEQALALESVEGDSCRRKPRRSSSMKMVKRSSSMKADASDSVEGGSCRRKPPRSSSMKVVKRSSSTTALAQLYGSESTETDHSTQRSLGFIAMKADAPGSVDGNPCRRKPSRARSMKVVKRVSSQSVEADFVMKLRSSSMKASRRTRKAEALGSEQEQETIMGLVGNLQGKQRVPSKPKDSATKGKRESPVQEMKVVAKNSSLEELMAVKRSLDRVIAERSLEPDGPDFDWERGLFVTNDTPTRNCAPSAA